MKKLFLLIVAVLGFCTAFAQEARISGRFLNLKSPYFRLILIGHQKLEPKHSFIRIPVKKDGSFSYRTDKIEELFKANIQLDGLVLGFFFENGYDLRITADMQNNSTFWNTLSFSGKGSEINSYWKKVYKQQLESLKSENANSKREDVFLRDFADSIRLATRLINSIKGSENPRNLEFYKRTLLDDQKLRSAKTLYLYSYLHQYTHAQTQNLLKKAGLPDAQSFLQRSEKFFIPPFRSIISHKMLFNTAGISPGVYFMYKSILAISSVPNKRPEISDQPLIRRSDLDMNMYHGLDAKTFRETRTRSIIINGENAVKIIALGITKANAADYKYRVIQNRGKELVEWSIPKVFKSTRNSRMGYAELGTFEYQDEQIISVEIKNVSKPTEYESLVIDWRTIKKPIANFEVEYISSLNSNSIQSQPMLGSIQQSTSRFVVAARPDIQFRLGDSLQNLAFSLRTNPETYFYSVALKRTTSEGNYETIVGKINTKLIVPKSFWDKPGKYEARFTPNIFKVGSIRHKDFSAQSDTIRFTILPPLDAPDIISAKELILIISSIVLIALLIFYLYRSRNKERLAQTEQQKELATLQLRSVRSQLNPHFMFNALAGIQNLMNRNEPDTANLYLTKFARLTRYVLDENDKDLVSIASEISLLEDYLQMEQMRFGFKYIFEVDEAIDKENTQIPSMLLQPFVENAVKHGVSGLNEKGLITIRFARQGKDLILQVTDNGKGFDKDSKGNGKGIALSESRIALYNSLYRETVISMKVEGTLVTITLKEWI